jgi:hypothetical protein
MNDLNGWSCFVRFQFYLCGHSDWIYLAQCVGPVVVSSVLCLRRRWWWLGAGGRGLNVESANACQETQYHWVIVTVADTN